MSKYKSFTHAAHENVTVYQFTKGNISAHDALLELANQNADLVQRVCAMDLVMPKRLREPNGTEHIYHTPDHLIPVTLIGSSPP